MALIVDLVPGEDLHSALSLNSAQFNLGRIVGPAIAAVLFVTAGAPWVFALNAVTFAVVAWVLTRVRPLHQDQGFTAPIRLPLWRGVREGVSMAARDPALRLILCTVFVVGLLLAPFIGFIPVFALRELGGGAELASLMTSVQGAGAVGAVLLLGPLVRRFGVPQVTLASVAVIGPATLLYWSAPGAPFAVVMTAVVGACYLGTLSGLNTLAQLRAPHDAHARISSLHSTLLGGGYAVGLIGFGHLADRYGLEKCWGPPRSRSSSWWWRCVGGWAA